jgi:hypothetical protein
LVAVRTQNAALGDLIKQALERPTEADQVGDVGFFRTRVPVIELEHHRVGLAALRARMCDQVLVDGPGIALSVARIVAPIALQVRGAVGEIVQLRTASSTDFALAVSLTLETVLQRELLAVTDEPTPTTKLPVQHPPHIVEHRFYKRWQNIVVA